MQGAESTPTPFRLGEPHHHEILGAPGSDFYPKGRPAALVRRITSFSHDPFQPELLNLLVEDNAIVFEVIQISDDAGERRYALEQPFSGGQREPAEIVALESQQVEGEKRDGAVHHRVADIECSPELRALLQALKAGAATFIERYQLTVQQHSFEREC